MCLIKNKQINLIINFLTNNEKWSEKLKNPFKTNWRNCEFLMTNLLSLKFLQLIFGSLIFWNFSNEDVTGYNNVHQLFPHVILENSNLNKSNFYYFVCR